MKDLLMFHSLREAGDHVLKMTGPYQSLGFKVFTRWRHRQLSTTVTKQNWSNYRVGPVEASAGRKILHLWSAGQIWVY